jgi:hypothetical protein
MNDTDGLAGGLRAEDRRRRLAADQRRCRRLTHTYMNSSGAMLARALPSDGPVPAIVLVRQTGEMWQKPGARRMRFEATEDFAVDRVAFSWRARFPIVGRLALTA